MHTHLLGAHSTLLYFKGLMPFKFAIVHQNKVNKHLRM